jgi:hypothetical protein
VLCSCEEDWRSVWTYEYIIGAVPSTCVPTASCAGLVGRKWRTTQLNVLEPIISLCLAIFSNLQSFWKRKKKHTLSSWRHLDAVWIYVLSWLRRHGASLLSACAPLSVVIDGRELCLLGKFRNIFFQPRLLISKRVFFRVSKVQNLSSHVIKLKGL